MNEDASIEEQHGSIIGQPERETPVQALMRAYLQGDRSEEIRWRVTSDDLTKDRPIVPWNDPQT